VLHIAIVTRLTPPRQGLPHNAAMLQIRSPLQAQMVQWLVGPGDPVHAGDVVAILEAMKMEHEVRAPADGRVVELLFAAGDMVNDGDLLLISELLTHIPRGARG
jgi:biotin carboxyl carrier protein